MENCSIKTFVNQNSNFEEEITALKREIHEAMIKQMYSIMTMGWYNSK